MSEPSEREVLHRIRYATVPSPGICSLGLFDILEYAGLVLAPTIISRESAHRSIDMDFREDTAETP